jgi:hypothetical protein
MVVVVPWLIIGLRHHINFGAPKARSSVHRTTNMQVKRLRLPARLALCPEPRGQAQLLAEPLGLKEVIGGGPIFVPECMQNPPVRQNALHPHEVVALSQDRKGDPIVRDRLIVAAQLLEDGPPLSQPAGLPKVVQVIQRRTNLSQCRPGSPLPVESERERHPSLGHKQHRLCPAGKRDRGSQMPGCCVQVLEVDRSQTERSFSDACGVRLATFSCCHGRGLRHGHGPSRVDLDQAKCLAR